MCRSSAGIRQAISMPHYVVLQPAGGSTSTAAASRRCGWNGLLMIRPPLVCVIPSFRCCSACCRGLCGRWWCFGATWYVEWCCDAALSLAFHTLWMRQHHQCPLGPLRRAAVEATALTYEFSCTQVLLSNRLPALGSLRALCRLDMHLNQPVCHRLLHAAFSACCPRRWLVTHGRATPCCSMADDHAQYEPA